MTYAHKLDKAEARLDWTLPAAQLARKVRAFEPWPVAEAVVAGERLRIHGAVALPRMAHDAPCRARCWRRPEGIDIACGDGALRLRCSSAKAAGRSPPPTTSTRARRLDAGERGAGVAARVLAARCWMRCSSRRARSRANWPSAAPCPTRATARCWKRSASPRCASARATTRRWQTWLQRRCGQGRDLRALLLAASRRSTPWACPRTPRCRHGRSRARAGHAPPGRHGQRVLRRAQREGFPEAGDRRAHGRHGCVDEDQLDWGDRAAAIFEASASRAVVAAGESRKGQPRRLRRAPAGRRHRILGDRACPTRCASTCRWRRDVARLCRRAWPRCRMVRRNRWPTHLRSTPGSRVLDACAAPGGKAAHLLERIPPCDCLRWTSMPRRLRRVRETLARVGRRTRRIARSRCRRN